MAIYTVFLFAVCLSATSAVQKPCGVGQCKLVLVGQNPHVKFQRLASEEGVRLVYFNLEIGNNSVHPLESSERFLAKWWIWAKTIREPMLLMTDDAHDIYSLGLLRRQKRYMTVQLEEQPTGCLSSLNASCQDNVVGEMLLGNFTSLSPGNRLPSEDCVCTFHKKRFSREGWETLCCSAQENTDKNDTVYRCGNAPKNGWFVKLFYSISFFLQLILVLYGPAIPLLLPDWIFNLQHECNKEKSSVRETAEIQQTVELEDDTDNQVTPINLQDRTVLRDPEENDDSQNELDSGCRQVTAINQQDGTVLIDLEENDDSQNELGSGYRQVTAINQHDGTVLIDPEENDDNQNELDSGYRQVTAINQQDGTVLIDPEENDDSQNELDSGYRQVTPINQQDGTELIDLEENDDSQNELDSGYGQNNNQENDSVSLEEFDSRCKALLDAENEFEFKIPVDDMSPITICALLSKIPLVQINFNIRLLLLFFVVFPFVLHIKLAVIFFYELEFYQEVHRKFDYNIPELLERIRFFAAPRCIAGDSWQNIVWQVENTALNATVCVVLFLILICIRPEDLLFQKRVGKAANTGVHCSDSEDSLSSLGEEIVQNLKMQPQQVCALTFSMHEQFMNLLQKCLMKLTLRHKIEKSRKKRALRSFCVMFSILPRFLVFAALGIAFILIFLVQFGLLLFLLTPSFSLLLFVIRKGQDIYDSAKKKNRCNLLVRLLTVGVSIPVTCFTFMYFLWYVSTTSVACIIRTFLFTIMGVALNVEHLTPYVVFILVVLGNINLCYLNLQNRYKEVKDMILEHWKEETALAFWMISNRTDGTVSNGICIKCSSNHDGTIPKELFWKVVGGNDESDENQILPLETEIVFMVRDMALILLFLYLFFLTVLIFETVEDISVIVSTFLVFISGVIPTLVFKRFTTKEKFSGYEKLQIEKKIKAAVHKYVLEHKKEILPLCDVRGAPIAWS